MNFKVSYDGDYNRYEITSPNIFIFAPIIIDCDYFGKRRARQIAIELCDLCNGEERVTPFEARLFKQARMK